jgi:hypothetical protein
VFSDIRGHEALSRECASSNAFQAEKLRGWRRVHVTQGQEEEFGERLNTAWRVTVKKKDRD